MKLYIGNLALETTEEDLRKLFQSHGETTSTTLILDRSTGESRGFAFVEMSDPAQAAGAIDALDGSEFQGRQIRVNESRPRQ